MTSPSWAVFDGFVAPSRRASWEPLAPFIEAGRAFALQQCGELPTLAGVWDERLRAWGGDPSGHDWTVFRPLRRETEWSDWLHHFLSTSTTGELAFALFGGCGFTNPSECASPSVKREDASESHFADLVITWASGGRTQLEVKVGDKQLAKTYDTADELQQKYGDDGWTHYLLLPREDVHRWHSVENDGRMTVHMITWDDVAIALRRCLWRRAEQPRWLAWACGFCGVIEQKLLGLPVLTNTQVDVRNVVQHVRQIAILRKGRTDD